MQITKRTQAKIDEQMGWEIWIANVFQNFFELQKGNVVHTQCIATIPTGLVQYPVTEQLCMSAMRYVNSHTGINLCDRQKL